MIDRINSLTFKELVSYIKTHPDSKVVHDGQSDVDTYTAYEEASCDILDHQDDGESIGTYDDDTHWSTEIAVDKDCIYLFEECDSYVFTLTTLRITCDADILRAGIKQALLRHEASVAREKERKQRVLDAEKEAIRDELRKLSGKHTHAIIIRSNKTSHWAPEITEFITLQHPDSIAGIHDIASALSATAGLQHIGYDFFRYGMRSLSDGWVLCQTGSSQNGNRALGYRFKVYPKEEWLSSATRHDLNEYKLRKHKIEQINQHKDHQND